MSGIWGILEGGVGMTACNSTSFVIDENVLKLDSGDSFIILMNMLKANELYTLKH